MMNRTLTLLLCLCFLHTHAQDTLLQRQLDMLDYFKLRNVLLGAAYSLTPDTRLYYSAIADNAFNRNELAIKRADSFKRLKTNVWTASQITRLNEMLLDSYMKTFRYREAAATAEVLKNQYTAGELGALQNIQDICNALSQTPPQTVTMTDATRIDIQRNQLNLWEIPVSIGGRQEQFIFDTGANISTISASYASKLGLTLIPVDVKVSAGQGKRVNSTLGVADDLLIGNAHFKNVVFLVIPDEQLNFPGARTSINGIIGFPVISAMKEVHISKSGTLTIPALPAKTGLQNMALNGFTPLVITATDADTLALQFDTGAATTQLFSNYLERHYEAVVTNSSRHRRKLSSVGGTKTIKVYELDHLTLDIAGAKAYLTDVMVHREPLRPGMPSIASGHIGQDVINQFSELVLNFDTMSLTLKAN